MVENSAATPPDVPEADLLEQQADLDDPDLSTPIPQVPAAAFVDEGDRLEQALPVPLSEEDYPHE